MNPTDLLPPAFRLVAGTEACRAERESMRTHVRPSVADPARSDGQSLVRWQETTGRQWSAVELVKSLYGWYVRYASGLDGFAILAGTAHRGGPLDGSFAEALAYARRWVAQEPARRYAFVRVYDLGLDPQAQVVLDQEAQAPTMGELREAGFTDPEWIAMVPPTEGNPTGYYRGVEFPDTNPLPLAQRPAWPAVAPHVLAFLASTR